MIKQPAELLVRLRTWRSRSGDEMRTLTTSALLAAPIAVSLQSSLVGGAILVGLFALLGHYCRNSTLAFMTVSLTGSLAVVLLFVLGRFIPGYSVDVRVVLVGLTIVIIASARFLRGTVSFMEISPIAAAGTAGMLGLLVWPTRSMSNGEALATIAGVDWYAEDNGAWLQALANMSVGVDTRFNSSGIYGAGHGTEFALGGVRELARLTTDWFDGTYGANANVLLAATCTVITVLALGSLVLGRQLLLGPRPSVDAALIPMSVVIFSLAAGMADVGHFSGVLVAMFLVLGLAWSTSAAAGSTLNKVVKFVLITVVLLAAWQSWIAIAAILVVFAALSIWDQRTPLVRAITGYGTRRSLLTLVGVVAAAGFLWTYLFKGFASIYLSWENVSTLLRLGGSVQSIRPELVLLVIGLAVTAVFSNGSRRVPAALRNLVVAMLVLLLLVVITAFSIPPFTPAYGPIKLTYIIVLALAPVAFAFVVDKSSVRGSRMLVMTIGLLPLLLVALLPPPGQKWMWTYRESSYGVWAKAVAIAAADPEQRVVGCITMDESGRPQEDSLTYLCARAALGLTGAATTPAGVLWMYAHACETPPEATRELWDEDFQRNLALVVKIADFGKPCGGASSSPVNPFEYIDWELVKMYDLNGNPWRPTK